MQNGDMKKIAIFNQYLASSRKRYKIRPHLEWKTNRNSYAFNRIPGDGIMSAVPRTRAVLFVLTVVLSYQTNCVQLYDKTTVLRLGCRH